MIEGPEAWARFRRAMIKVSKERAASTPIGQASPEYENAGYGQFATGAAPRPAVCS
jgi:hypothetical protein